MNLNEIKNKFKEINKIYFEKEQNTNFLKIEVNLKTLEEVSKISKQINEYIDNISNDEDESFFLEIFSSGTDKILEISELKDNISKNVLINNKIEGLLLQVEDNKVILRINEKGHFKKIEIKIEEIEEIKLFAKVNK